MKIALTSESNLSHHQFDQIADLSDSLKFYFEEKDYGKDLKEHLINIICVKQEFDFFFKIRKPKYHKILNTVEHGVSIKSEKTFSYDIKFSHEDFIRESGGMSLVATKIIESLDLLDELPKTVKDFDKEQYKLDVTTFLEKYKRFL